MMNQYVEVPFPEEWDEFDVESEDDLKGLVEHLNIYVDDENGTTIFEKQSICVQLHFSSAKRLILFV